MKIVLFGPPGVGKGTYASMLTKMYTLPHVSSGDLFRENVKNKTELGLSAKEFIDNGDLVPDEITMGMVKNRIKDENGFFLDGVPRTIAQAKILDEFTKIDIVVNFFANKEILIKRISGRRLCGQCQAVYNIETKKPIVEGKCDDCQGELYQRTDEMPDVVENRLEVYEKQTKPVLDFYKEKGLLRDIDANKDMSHPEFSVIDEVKEILDKIAEVV